ncbi:DoxX family protein [Iodobacter fluviatilis]|uniref:DoxX n=1 Tax=Iodobacter fluviatilis TaxID=537 RepID=A0A377SUB2_9NEIS|nr:DoxX family protein [Iodobacter fluviatilis]TCU88112.1 putative oxidoreductase [Iodobacter fluviatilis]STR45612.1 DoxX [Iodobacter fluviatilis]
MKKQLCKLYSGYRCAESLCIPYLSPVFNLGLRIYLAQVFFMSGLTKIRNWDGTLFLFNFEYQVPFIPPEMAAIMAAGGELILPVLLISGSLGRFAAAGLFILNLMAVISYPALLPIALKDHYLWGALLAVLAIYGAGKWSVDEWLNRRCQAGQIKSLNSDL